MKSRAVVAAVSVAASVLVGGLSIRAPWVLAALAAALPLMVVLVVRARRAVLALTVAVLVVGSGSLPLRGNLVFYGRFALMALLLLANLVQGSGSTRRLRGWFAPALVALVALAVTSTLWSVDPSLTLQRSVAFGILVAAVLSSASRVWRDVRDLRADLEVVAGVLGAAMAVNIVLYASSPGWAYSGERFRGILENPNTIGVTAALVIPLVLGLAQGARIRRPLWIAFGVATIANLVLSQSRGGLLGATAGVLIFVVRRGDTKADRRGLILGLMSLVSLAFALVAATSVRPLSDPSGRLDAWEAFLDLRSERPVLGWGFGAVELVLPERLAPQTTFRGAIVPNAFLQAVGELGPLGLALLAPAVASAYRSGSAVARAPLSRGVLGALAAGIVVELGEAGMVSAGSILAFNFWLVAAGAAWLGSTRSDAARAPARAGPARRHLVSER